MSALTPEKILEYINTPNEKLEAAKKEHKKLVMHVHGIGVAEYLVKIEGLENEEKYKLRKRLSRSNKDLIASLLRPADKIFTAKGGSITYGIESESKQAELQRIILDIEDGVSLYKWAENIWFDKYITDPNGLIMLENEVENGEKRCYPTYKSCLTIRNYEQCGQWVEWVIFDPFKKDDSSEYFRVYDSTGDYTYKKTGNELELIEEFQNPWGYVPAMLCSDLVDPMTEYKKSAMHEQLELLDECLREGTVKTLLKYHHGFPMFWQYLQQCPVCKGLGSVNNAKCPACNGTRYVNKKDVSDIHYVKVPEDKDEPVLAPNLAGYIAPPIDSINMLTAENKLLRDMVVYSYWGTVIQNESVEKTATEVFINAQPVEERLNKHSDSYQIIIRGIIDMVGYYYYGDEYKSTSFNAGRNYQVKGVSQLQKEYNDLKTAKVGEILLNNKLDELINAKYQNDAYNLTINLKLAAVEPFVHNTIEEVKGFEIDEYIYNQKLYFNLWLTNQTNDYIFKTNVTDLQKSLEEFSYNKSNSIKIKKATESIEVPNLQDMALNGAQTQSLIEVLTAYSTGIINRESSIAVIRAAFPMIPIELVNKIVQQKSQENAKVQENSSN